MEEKMKKSRYIIAYFEGLNRDWLSEEPISFTDNYFSNIQFLKDKQVKLFIRSDAPTLSNEAIQCKAKGFLFRLYIQFIKMNSSAPHPFSFDVLEINNDKLLLTQRETVCVQEKVEVFRYHSDGTPVTAEEYAKQQNEIAQSSMIKLIQETLTDRTYLSADSTQKVEQINNLRLLNKVLQIEDRVIRYCMLYDWLYSFFRSQSKTASFIRASIMYNEISQTIGPKPPLEKPRYNSAKECDEQEDIFTYCRNEVGHSAASIIGFSEEELLGYIDFLIWPLFRILLEKIEADESRE